MIHGYRCLSLGLLGWIVVWLRLHMWRRMLLVGMLGVRVIVRRLHVHLLALPRYLLGNGSRVGPDRAAEDDGNQGKNGRGDPEV